MSGLRALVASKQSLYSLLQIFQRVGWLLTLPFISFYWSADDYAKLLLLQSFINLVAPIASFNVYIASRRLGYGSDRSGTYSEMFWMCSIWAVVQTTAIIAILVLVGDPFGMLAKLTGDSSISKGLVALMVVSQVCYLVAIVNQRLDRNLKNISWSIVLSNALVFTVIGSGVLLKRTSFDTIVLALVFGNLSYCGVSALRFPSWGVPQCSRLYGISRRVLRYTLPTLAHLGGLWIITYSSRWVSLENYTNPLALKEFLNATLLVQLLLLINTSIFDGYVRDYSLAIDNDDPDGVSKVIRTAASKAVQASFVLIICVSVGLAVQYWLHLDLFLLKVKYVFTLIVVAFGQIAYSCVIHLSLARERTIATGIAAPAVGLAFLGVSVTTPLRSDGAMLLVASGVAYGLVAIIGHKVLKRSGISPL